MLLRSLRVIAYLVFGRAKPLKHGTHFCLPTGNSWGLDMSLCASASTGIKGSCVPKESTIIVFKDISGNFLVAIRVALKGPVKVEM